MLSRTNIARYFCSNKFFSVSLDFLPNNFKTTNLKSSENSIICNNVQEIVIIAKRMPSIIQKITFILVYTLKIKYLTIIIY